MIYLLGGPPRVGKSVISSRIRQKHALSVVSTDSLAKALENVLSPETAPDLFVFNAFNEIPIAERIKFFRIHPAEIITFVKRESHLVWQAVEGFIQSENEEGRAALIEGVAVLPELVKQMEGIPYQAVFIGNQGQNHKENIKKAAQENDHDWMRGLGDDYISAFAEFVRLMSEYIEKEARKYGYEYIEMDSKPLKEVTGEIERAYRLDSG